MTEHTHKQFDAEMEAIRSGVLTMGGLVETQLARAIQMLQEEGDHAAVLDAVGADEQAINRMQVEIDNRAFTVLALHQPLAVDLRVIVAAVKINSDLERVGDLAVNIAEAALRYLALPPVKPLIDLPRMSEIAEGMLRDALDAFVRRDVELAQSVLKRDDQLDELKSQVFRELLTYMLQNPATIEASLELILISRHLERIGDHATNVAEDVIFMVSARDVRHHSDTGR